MLARRTVALGYGRHPLEVSVPADAQILRAPSAPAATRPLAELCADALAHPVAAQRLRGRIRRDARLTIIVSDTTREEPRAALVCAVLDEIGERVTLRIAVANGTHAPGPIDALGLPADVLARASLWNHDARDDAAFVDVGVTRRGTRVRFPRVILDSDLVVATGRIRPHYFAGFGAGSKAVFPGLGHNDDIRANHRLKSDPSSRLGAVQGNACRDDLVEAASLLPVQTYLLNVIANEADQPVAAVSGDLVEAHRAGIAVCRPLCQVDAARADVVVVSGRLPLSGSLYQASKLLAPAGPLLRPGGVAVLAAECPFGTGPLSIVNEGIYRIGIAKLFPDPHIIYLVSSLAPDVVAQTYCRRAETVESVLALHTGDVAVIPEAANVIPWIHPSSDN